MKVLIVDNYDSFTWNIVQMLEADGARCIVHRCDAMDAGEALTLGADRILLSPGPFGPERTGMSPELVRRAPADLPILGICLGMQVIAAVAGAAVRPSGAPVHGKARLVEHDGTGVLRELPSPLRVGLYHSLIVDPRGLPADLRVTARSRTDETIMAFRLAGRPVEGVLFHPESFLTEQGERILANFMAGS